MAVKIATDVLGFMPIRCDFDGEYLAILWMSPTQTRHQGIQFLNLVRMVVFCRVADVLVRPVVSRYWRSGSRRKR